MPDKTNRIYAATYSNVPVYEFNLGGNHIMRRRSDDWINATHILKVADFDKPARTRILEREVQKGVHEKVQGGYGKYQGTWVPLSDGRILAERNGVLEKLLPIFEYVPGDRSPPPAPKHATAASNKPKVPRQPAARRRLPVPQHSRMSDVSYDTFSNQLNESETPDNGTMASDSEEERFINSQYSESSRKRKRGVDEVPVMTVEDQQHLMWSDELLDYFMLANSNEPRHGPPIPPESIDVNRPVDDKGHTPMHWAAAMGDLTVVRNLLQRHARIDTLANNGETPLMRSVMFTNNFSQSTMGELISLLYVTVAQKDWFGSTVIHQVVMLTNSKSKYNCARYYLEVILAKLSEVYPPEEIASLLNEEDHNGDTAILLAARHGARRCIRILMSYGAVIDLPNHRGETADELIKQLNARRRERNLQGSSSPALQLDGASYESRQPGLPGPAPLPQYHSEAAALLTSQLPTLINSRAEALAAALDAELGNRDQEALEATRLLEQRRHEIQVLRSQARVLTTQDHDETHDEAQRDQLRRLRAEYHDAVELAQRRELQHRLSAKAAAALATDGVNAEHTTRLQLARALAEEQAARAGLIEAFVSAQALAGGGGSGGAASAAGTDVSSTDAPAGVTSTTLPPGMSRMDAYKRLITSALGVRAEDVESLLDDLLAELEAVKAGDDGASGFAVGTAAGAPAGAAATAAAVHGDRRALSPPLQRYGHERGHGHLNGADAVGLGLDPGLDLHASAVAAERSRGGAAATQQQQQQQQAV